MITYHQLRTFLAVVRLGNLTRAARELNATQPTVSLQLNALRHFLGAPLFERSSGKFRLTPAGEMLHRYADEAVGKLRILQQDVDALKNTLSGPLAVGMTYVLSRYVLPSTLSRFRQRFPTVDLQLHVDFPRPLFNGLSAKTLDVIAYIGVDTPVGLTVESLYDERFVIFASPRHPLAGRRRVNPRELSGLPLVASTTAVLNDVMETKLRAVSVTPRVVAEGKHHDAIKQLVEADVGYSILVEPSVRDELASGRLVELQLAAPPIYGTIAVAYLAQPIVPPLVRSFIQFVRAALTAGRERSELITRRVTPAGSQKRRKET